MLLTALPPAPPTPHTMMRGFNSRSSGAFILIDIAGLIFSDARRRRLTAISSVGARRVRRADALPQKLCFNHRPTRAT